MARIRLLPTALSLALMIGLPALVAHAGAREDSRACWENYALCASGAGDMNSWRTVCYSDYTACMGNTPPVECLPDDEAYCSDARTRCAVRSSDLDNGDALCSEDHQVCLDTHGC
jgi:hypothetical protein